MEAIGPRVVPGLDAIRSPPPVELMRRRALKHASLLFGGATVVIFACVALLAPWLAPYDPFHQDLTRRLIDPVWGEGGTWLNILGTDGLGRDTLSRLIHGARVSLMVGFGAACIAMVVGSTIGIVGGYFGGRIDALVIYLINVKLAMPGLVIALALVSIVGGSLTALVLILGFLTWDRFAVVTRSATQQLRSDEFIIAARATGASIPRILLYEVLPNVANQIIVVASLEIAVVILIEAALSFLGLGVQPPTPSWGLMVAEARGFMFFKPHLVFFPGVAIFLLVMAINMAGDGLRDVSAPEGAR
jgi:peptide/nickel transport system permease protein